VVSAISRLVELLEAAARSTAAATLVPVAVAEY
jgi:hypothetical protein